MQKKQSNSTGDTGLRSSGLLQFRTNRSAAIEVFYGQIEAEKLRLVIDTVTRSGGAIMFGRTSDGGAFSVCVLSGADKLKEYPHTPEELQELIGNLVEHFT